MAAQGFLDAAVALLHRQVFHDELAADVGGHDEHGVFEIHRAALTIRDTAVIEHLQEDIENIRVGFFHLVKEDDRVGLAANGFAELAAFFVADIAGRRPDEAGDGVLLHVFGHVETDDRGFVIEEKFGKGFREFRFADAGRT